MEKKYSYPRQNRQRARSGASLEAPVPAVQVLHSVLNSLGAGPERERLYALWQNWNFVMGEDLAPLAHPLGQHKGILLIGAEDAMLMQELHFLSGEILERANAFMAENFFSSVRISLLLNKTILNQPVCLPGVSSSPRQQTEPGPPPPRGSFLAGMDPASPVARCYARFAIKRDERALLICTDSDSI